MNDGQVTGEEVGQRIFTALKEVCFPHPFLAPFHCCTAHPFCFVLLLF